VGANLITYLAVVSYSLYLANPLVAQAAIRLHREGVLPMGLAMISFVAGSLVLAHCCHLLVAASFHRPLLPTTRALARSRIHLKTKTCHCINESISAASAAAPIWFPSLIWAPSH
jgi:peptidoglycan/LPS O-acetylase OafA/YrhL